MFSRNAILAAFQVFLIVVGVIGGRIPASLKAALTLHFAFCNFCRIYGTLRVTSAMEAEITDHVWTLAGLFNV